MILVIESDRDCRHALAELLSRQGYEVVCAASGMEALEVLHSPQTVPALILLDPIVPVLGGWSFLKEHHNGGASADAPVVLMSGLRDAPQKAINIGAIACLLKPIDPRTLLRVVDRFNKPA
jgi:DNA-binding response OmpR family regulator